MKTLFSTLLENNVSFFVGVNQKPLKIGKVVSSNNYVGRDYFVSISKSDSNILPNIVEEIIGVRGKITERQIPFKKEQGTTKNILTYTMNERDINEFKTIQDKFVKVIHNSDGRIFELKSKPFKKHLESLV